MIKYIRFVLLLMPLYLYILIWDSMVFHLGVPRFNYNAPSWIEDVVGPIALFVGLPLSFFIGSIYTAYKKLWWWFAAYMILAGFPLSLFIFG
ncbi:hypothetical protein [Vibrio sp. M260112]|uniref:hypothetical protein n=1 Tax=Vibrio sp. M260112 TaxID=3020895 RepID=UPI002F42D13B